MAKVNEYSWEYNEEAVDNEIFFYQQVLEQIN